MHVVVHICPGLDKRRETLDIATRSSVHYGILRGQIPGIKTRVKNACREAWHTPPKSDLRRARRASVQAATAQPECHHAHSRPRGQACHLPCAESPEGQSARLSLPSAPETVNTQQD